LLRTLVGSRDWFHAIGGFGQKLVEFIDGQPQSNGLSGDLAQLIDKSAAMSNQAYLRRLPSGKRALAVPHFEQAFAT
jgi:hypothetical protein